MISDAVASGESGGTNLYYDAGSDGSLSGVDTFAGLHYHPLIRCHTKLPERKPASPDKICKKSPVFIIPPFTRGHW